MIRGREVLLLAAAVVGGAVLERAGGAEFLWVFPLVHPGLALWISFAAADLLLQRSGAGGSGLGRLLLWCVGLMFFCARSGFPGVGLVLITLPAALWVASRRGRSALLRLAGPTLVAVFFLGHDSQYFHWSVAGSSVLGWRFSVHLVALFLFFRSCSWLAAVAGREERPSFLLTMEYFIAPAFWLSPLHANHLVWEHMEDAGGEDERALLWLGRGLAHAVLLSLFGDWAIGWLGASYQAGFHALRWYEWSALGPILFLLAYLDKSQVSYLTAGCLKLSGRNVEPDFRAPWAARDLLDYWRRFHFWLWEFYMSVIYLPLSLALGRRLRPERALPLALFLSFTLGTGLAHYLSYRAGILPNFLLALAFGGATMVHYYLRPWLARPVVGVPLTWLTVFLLYILAYPVFGLGWGAAEFRQFWR